MFYQLEIENFHSIRDSQVIDLRVAKNVPSMPDRLASDVGVKGNRVPKVVAFFGANASGKSTVLRALSLLKWFIRDSFKDLDPTGDAADRWQGFQPFDRFRSDSSKGPTRLTLHFVVDKEFRRRTILSGEGKSLRDELRHVYEVVFDNQAGRPQNVLSETLRVYPKAAGKPSKLFERRGNEVTWTNASFKLSSYGNVFDKIRDNCSLVSTLAQFDHGPSISFRDYFNTLLANMFVEKHNTNERAFIEAMYLGGEKKFSLLDALNGEIERFDLGIKAIQAADHASKSPLLFEHVGLSDALPLQHESHGTREFLKIYPILLLTLASGGIAVIDELDQSVHALLLPEIIGWFHDPKRNPHNAQLWMSCHNPFLFDCLTKEEVFFCEKDSDGATRVYGLRDIENVRRSDNIYKKYIGGMFGAVPRVG